MLAEFKLKKIHFNDYYLEGEITQWIQIEANMNGMNFNTTKDYLKKMQMKSKP